MNVLVLGSGGREHSFAWVANNSKLSNKVFIAPGNGGTQSVAQNVQLNIGDFEAIANFCLQENVELIIVGPENPLVDGIVDFFANDEKLAKIAILGPEQKAAMLEGSKAFAKEFMLKYQIPTAAYRQFSGVEFDQAKEYLHEVGAPIVLKADGLAAGKGVRVCFDLDEADSALTDILLDKKYGEAGASVVIEQYLKGIELSVFALTDGEKYVLLPTAKDYKRIGEGDSGLNTGGMGAISPVPFATAELMDKVITKVVEPTMKGIKNEQFRYRGFVYFGLMIVDGEPFVIEYNCRMGDPETEAVLPLIESDLLEAMHQAAKGDLQINNLSFKDTSAATVILVSKGYPEDYEKGKLITMPNKLPNDSLVFHMGTNNSDNGFVTSGGRVLALTSFNKDPKQALAQSYDLANEISFEGKNYRKDIGFDIL